jgi:hypothetical protein
MKKTALALIFIFIVFSSIAQIVSYNPFAAYYRAKETSWEWTSADLKSDEIPTLRVTYNNNDDVLSRVDRLKIDNSFEDDFKFPYKGEFSNRGIIYSVIDNKGKRSTIVFDFTYYDEGYFDIVIKYNNFEYAYRILK